MSPLDTDLKVALGELVLAKAAQEKLAAFKALGTGADWLAGKGLKGLWNVVKPAARGLGSLAKGTYNVGMEAGGIRGLSNEERLLGFLRARGARSAATGGGDVSKAWDTIRDLAKSKGVKNPVTAFSALMNPGSSLSPRVSEGGYARYLLGELNNPTKLKQFSVGATPDQLKALETLKPYFAQGRRAGHISAMGQYAPIAAIGGPLAYHLAKGDESAERPVVTTGNTTFSDKTGAAKPLGLYALFEARK